MHGIILSEIKQFVESRHGASAWTQLSRDAGLTGKIYLPIGEYSDEEAHRLFAAASQATGVPVQRLLEDFGEFIAPRLIAMYASLIDPEWRTLDVIEKTEERMHRLVRLHKPEARPPMLKTVRTSPREVVLTYSSPRLMCSVAKGIVRSLGTRYHEQISLSEPTCMYRKDPVCTLRIRKLD